MLLKITMHILTPLNILEVMIKTNDDIKLNIKKFSVDPKVYIKKLRKHTKKSKKK